jgi:hypothetical protein
MSARRQAGESRETIAALGWPGENTPEQYAFPAWPSEVLVRGSAVLAAVAVFVTGCSSGSASSGAPKIVSKPSIRVVSPTTFTVPGLNHLGEDLVYCRGGPVPPSSNTAEGFGVFVPPNPNRLLVCGYRGTSAEQLLFDRGVVVPAPRAIGAALDAVAPRRTATGLADVCPATGQEALVLVFGFSYRLTVFAYVTASGCAYELLNNTTINVPPSTLTDLRNAVGYSP